MSRVINAFQQFLDGAGNPLIYGWIRFLVSNSNNTNKDTYSDSNENYLNTNPIQLDAEGRVGDIFGTGTYRGILYSNDTELNQPLEQIQVKDPIGGTTGTSDFSDWNSVTIYNLGDVVKAEDRNFYSSLKPANQSNQPITALAYWMRINFIETWNPTITYQIGDRIRYDGNGLDYAALTVNTNKIPSANPTDWSDLGTVVIAPGTDNTIVRYTGSAAIQDSGISIDDSDNMTGGKIYNAVWN